MIAVFGHQRDENKRMVWDQKMGFYIGVMDKSTNEKGIVLI